MDLESPRLRLLECCRENLRKHFRRWNYVNISAPYWRLYWNDRPGAFIRHVGKRIAMTPDRLFLVPPNTVFSTVHRGHVRQLYLHFQVLTPYLRPAPSIIILPLEPSLRILSTDVLAALNRHDSPSWRLPMAAYALIALALSKTIMPDDSILSLDPRILHVVVHIEKHLGKVLTNGELAQQAGVSVDTLIRLFKAQTGHTPRNYLRLKRIEQAGLLLHFSNDSIKQIAETVGFCDRYYFSRVFAQVHGMGPAKFRHWRYLRTQDWNHGANVI